MGVITYDSEVTSPIPPARLFKAFVLDADNLIPKISPHTIKSTEILEGNGGPGTIKKVTFHEGSHFKFLKHKIDAINKENFTYNYSVIEGGPLSDKIEKISYETKLVATPDGGSIFKSTSKYYAKDDFEIKEEQIKTGKEKAAGFFKSVEGYLLANPDAYN
ncbi:major allergen Pru ar 1-like [Castanea sativa]|uniref:major allergen Pru ar 1-like n=1 Tax=Castanea sativa TaxID=21020 RepID=UPI003F64A201